MLVTIPQAEKLLGYQPSGIRELLHGGVRKFPEPRERRGKVARYDLEELREALPGGDPVICQECGNTYRNLGPHLFRHGMTKEDYRAAHGAEVPLMAAGTRQAIVNSMVDWHQRSPAAVEGMVQAMAHLPVNTAAKASGLPRSTVVRLRRRLGLTV